MQSKYFKNQIIPLTLIVSLVLMPLSVVFPKKANAQSAMVGASGVLAASLPLCVGEVGSSIIGGISGLFKGTSAPRVVSKNNIAGGASDPTIPTGLDAGGRDGNGMDEAIDVLLKENSGISTRPETLNQSLNAAGEPRIPVEIDAATAAHVQQIAYSTGGTEDAQKKQTNHDTCLKSIGKALVKMTLQKITVSTIDWINGGMDGSPKWVTGNDSFWKNIAKNEILTFNNDILGNPEMFPFGKEWVRNQALAAERKFADNARYSLNEAMRQTDPEFTDVKFIADFSQGGWDAWGYMTQVPANTPMGFNMMSSEELNRRLAGTQELPRGEQLREDLRTAGGFLGDEKCSSNRSLTRAQSYEEMKNGKPDPCTGVWEYVTPGLMVAELATKTVGYADNWLLAADDFNSAIAAVADAFINHYTTKWITDGLAGMDRTGIDGAYMYDSGSGTSFYGQNQTEKDFMPIHRTRGWLQHNPNFNIRSDLTQALIDEQRTYVMKLEEQNREIFSTTDGGNYVLDGSSLLSNATGLLPVIYQLDYCIPGPHPGWKEDSQANLYAVLNKIPPQTAETLGEKFTDQDAKAITQAFGSAAVYVIAAEIGLSGLLTSALGLSAALAGTGAGLLIVGAGWLIYSLIIDSIWGGEDTATEHRKALHMYYMAYIRAMTGMTAVQNDALPNTSSYSGVRYIMQNIYDQYINFMDKTYEDSNSKSMGLMSVVRASEVEFNKAKSYVRLIEQNEKEIAKQKMTIGVLTNIKQEVDKLNGSLASGQIDQKEYEEQLMDQINAFGRISIDMISAMDIARQDNIVKEIIDLRTYVYNDLLKGPHGCEQVLAKEIQPPFMDKYEGKSYNILSVKRMTYPSVILYDYSDRKVDMGPNSNYTIPDPLGDGKYRNKLPEANSMMKFYNAPDGERLVLGPGFLPFIRIHRKGNPRPDHLPPAGMIRVGNLIWSADSWSGSEYIGQRNDYKPHSEGGGSWGSPFEFVAIGIY